MSGAPAGWPRQGAAAQGCAFCSDRLRQSRPKPVFFFSGLATSGQQP
ncbi:hypothetical protein [Xenorhabdus nematophila]|nr:hypothetical protein [Xenorhabdus nematophila]